MKGSLVLGQVWEINDLDIVVALPNNLTGHVSLTAVSTAFTKRVEAAAADDSEEDDNADVELRNIFTVGQYVRAYVLSTIEDAVIVGKSKRRIELSLRPEEANAGLSEGDVVEHSTVMAAVASVEDHGYVMDLGIAGSKLRGFLSKKEASSSLEPGSVQLCLVTGKVTNGKVVQLTTKNEKLGSLKEFPRDATTINTFLPGTVVDVLVSDVSRRGIVGKVLGSLDVTADLIHSGHGPNGTDLEAKYKVGSKLKARVICTFPEAKDPKLGVSILDHVSSLTSKTAGEKSKSKSPLEVLPISSLVESCTVTKVEADIGLFVDIGIKNVPGFVHISRVKDGKVDALYESSGPFKVGSVHRGRVVGYTPMDGVFHLSFEQNILDQPFLRLEDVPIGEVVNATIEKLIVGENGVHGMILKLSEGISGLVSEMHLADVRLQHPEKKFREGMKVKARVLSTDLVKRQLRLTLKKTLVNSDAPAIKSFDEVSPGMQVPGTIVTFLKNGAIVQFYGSLRGFLPISEMSEAFIQDPKEHFRVGQVVTVHVLDVDADSNRLVVSCKDPSAFGMERQVALKNLKVGDIVSGKVSQKTEDDVFVELEGSLLKAIIHGGHLTDKSANKNQAALKKIHVGQTLSELVVLEKNEARRAVTLSQKPSLVAAAKDGKLLASLDQAKAGDLVAGFVRNITPTAVFVQFASNVTALLPKAMMTQESQTESDFGLRKLQSLTVKIISVDREHSRAVVAIPSVADAKEPKISKTSGSAAANPIDEAIQSIEDIVVGTITKAKVVSVKETQVNVRLADNIQGRIDVSEVFDTWDEISNRKNPLRKFKANDVVSVRVLGVHDAKKHRFLPITHRSTHSLFELSAKPSDLKASAVAEPLVLDDIKVGSKLVAYVNNVSQNCLWVNITPNVRGRVEAIEASGDLSLLGDLGANFPVGSALRVKVVAVDASQNRLDLSARTNDSTESLTWDTIKQDLVLPGKITKVSERQVMVKLSEIVSGPIHLADIADDYEHASTLKFSKNGVVRVSIVDLDKSNKRIRLSTRPSRILNSSLPVEDREIKNANQLQVGDVVRGFVKNVADKGVFVSLGGEVSAMVRISDLSDSFLKNWKSHFQVDQLVKGRITALDETTGQVQMSLKASVVEKDFVPLRTYSDFKVGQVVTGKVRAVEEFGAFIVIDKSDNVSGLCHRSEMADKKVTDAKKLYNKDDVVKARILKIDSSKKRISFGLKASYFEDEDDEMDSDEDEGAPLFSDDEDEDEDSGDELTIDATGDIVITGTDNHEESDDEEEDIDMDEQPSEGAGLSAGAFDWSGAALDAADDGSDAASEAGADSSEKKKKKKSRKPEIQIDRTAELDVHGPQTASDFERLLLGQPDSSELWRAYMAFQLQVSEPSKAREIAERAIKTINIREETEKLNMWIAYLNLENAYGSDETLDEVFKRACQYNDEQEVYERLTSIYIQTDKHKVR